MPLFFSIFPEIKNLAASFSTKPAYFTPNLSETF
jgi:hypothetical protein